MAILKHTKRGDRLTKPAKREVSMWYSSDLRSFLFSLSLENTGSAMCEDAAEALAYLRWRNNHRFADLPTVIEGGYRCTAEKFEAKKPAL